jgi:acetyl-CoA carboxylase carboxyl transferase subunit alpha
MNELNTTAFERVRKARQPDRPYTSDLLDRLFTDFSELHGDRRFADDPAIICGFANLDELKVAIIGHQKGRDTNQRKFRNFGMPKPEGYRKALRIMKLAEKFGRPIVTFIDTPGAYPGIDAEERGQAEAIAFNLREMANLRVPIIAVVIGEGGSGGALAIGIADSILMMENSVYSVISPEGCAAILWKNAEKAPEAADCLKMTSDNLKDFKLIDQIVGEEQVIWGYASDNEKEGNSKIFLNLKSELKTQLTELQKMSVKDLQESRYKKFRDMGSWV